jgi:hypothetical protein
MFCHRLLRPIADTRTAAEGTDSNTLIDRGRGTDGPARRSPQPARPHVSLILAAQPIISAALRASPMSRQDH